jgi:hypothetical protein
VIGFDSVNRRSQPEPVADLLQSITEIGGLGGPVGRLLRLGPDFILSDSDSC